MSSKELSEMFEMIVASPRANIS